MYRTPRVPGTIRIFSQKYTVVGSRFVILRMGEIWPLLAPLGALARACPANLANCRRSVRFKTIFGSKVHTDRVCRKPHAIRSQQDHAYEAWLQGALIFH